MSGLWRAAAAPVLAGVVAGVLVALTGTGTGPAQPTTGTGLSHPAAVASSYHPY